MDSSPYLSTSTEDSNERKAGKLSLDKEIRDLYDEFKKKGGDFSEASVGIILHSDRIDKYRRQIVELEKRIDGRKKENQKRKKNR